MPSRPPTLPSPRWRRGSTTSTDPAPTPWTRRPPWRSRSMSSASDRLRPLVATGLAVLALAAGSACVAPPDQDAVDTSAIDEPPVVDPRTYTVRIRSQTCEGLGVGSGFLIDPSTIVTNRHVVEGAETLEVD